MMNNAPLKNATSPAQAFSPLVGQLAWAVSNGFGTFITMEFGAPHLRVRDPGVRRASASAKVRRLAGRRSVVVTGDWHLFVEFAAWRVTSVNGSISSTDDKRAGWKGVLDDISGQRLLSAGSPAPGRLILTFDLGGKVEIWPHPEIDNDVWTLHPWTGSIIGCRHDGTIEVGESKHDRRMANPNG